MSRSSGAHAGADATAASLDSGVDAEAEGSAEGVAAGAASARAGGGSGGVRSHPARARTRTPAQCRSVRTGLLIHPPDSLTSPPAGRLISGNARVRPVPGRARVGGTHLPELPRAAARLHALHPHRGG